VVTFVKGERRRAVLSFPSRQERRRLAADRVAGQRRTNLHNTNRAPGRAAWLGWIVDMMSRDSLPRTLEALRQRAATR